jgi:hypothetical protein
MKINFFVHKIARNRGPFFDIVKPKCYPNLAEWQGVPYEESWGEYSVNWPYTYQVDQMSYMMYTNVDFDVITSIKDINKYTFYPIAVSFFDFTVDWFGRFDPKILKLIKHKQLKVIFFYSEGDNPYHINDRLNEHCKEYNVPREQIYFVSANSVADNLQNFYYFMDDELMYQYSNRRTIPVTWTDRKRSKKFTALVRVHKWWRATIMAQIWKDGLHDQGYFGYLNKEGCGDVPEDNPLWREPDLEQALQDFMNATPFKADDLNSDDHNDHEIVLNEHFNDSYLNLVIETHMDVDGSDGIFLTEKTFKPIKHGQLFLMFGAAGSIQILRDYGYKVFDDVIDHSYDNEPRTTERFQMAYAEAKRLIELPHEEWIEIYRRCKSDILYNQKHFVSSKTNRVQGLWDKILKDI